MGLGMLASLPIRYVVLGGLVTTSVGTGAYLQVAGNSYTQVVALDTKSDAIDNVSTIVEPALAVERAAILPDLIAPVPAWSVTQVRSATLDARSIFPIGRTEPTDSLDQEDELAIACDHHLTPTVMSDAMVKIELSSDCMKNQNFVLHHFGMAISARTDIDGNAMLEVPVLTENAVFIVAFANGEGAVANVQVPDAADFARTLIQTTHPETFYLHAFENDAAFGEVGHVWVQASLDASPSKGHIVSLGDASIRDAKLVQVYSFPVGSEPQAADDVLISIEANITDENCGLDVDATALQFLTNQSVQKQDISILMPDCDAVGDYLVFDNIFEDLQFASN